LNKRLAVTLKISWALRVSILHIEGELKELLRVTPYTRDNLIWHSMIDKLPITIGYTLIFVLMKSGNYDKKFR
jgi:hypothetical protein